MGDNNKIINSDNKDLDKMRHIFEDYIKDKIDKDIRINFKSNLKKDIEGLSYPGATKHTVEQRIDDLADRADKLEITQRDINTSLKDIENIQKDLDIKYEQIKSQNSWTNTLLLGGFITIGIATIGWFLDLFIYRASQIDKSDDKISNLEIRLQVLRSNQENIENNLKNIENNQHLYIEMMKKKK